MVSSSVWNQIRISFCNSIVHLCKSAKFDNMKSDENQSHLRILLLTDGRASFWDGWNETKLEVFWAETLEDSLNGLRLEIGGRFKKHP